jgi:hypothetical protein
MYLEAVGKAEQAELLYKHVLEEEPSNDMILKRLVRAACLPLLRRLPLALPARRRAWAGQRQAPERPALRQRAVHTAGPAARQVPGCGGWPRTAHMRPLPVLQVAVEKTRGNTAGAIEALRRYLDAYQNDREGWEELAELYLEVGAVQGAAVHGCCAGLLGRAGGKLLLAPHPLPWLPWHDPGPPAAPPRRRARTSRRPSASRS